MKRTITASYMVIIALFITGCVSENSAPIPTLTKSMNKEQFFSNLRNDSSWLGIKMEKTNFIDAKHIIEENFDISHINWSVENQTFGWEINSWLDGRLEVDNDVVSNIWFNIYENKITLSDFIDKFGNPDSYAIIKRVSGDCPSYLSTLYFYHKEGIVLTHIICNDPQKYVIRKDNPVTYIYLFPVDKVDNEITEIYTYDLGEKPDIRSIQLSIAADMVIE